MHHALSFVWFLAIKVLMYYFVIIIIMKFDTHAVNIVIDLLIPIRTISHVLMNTMITPFFMMQFHHTIKTLSFLTRLILFGDRLFSTINPPCWLSGKSETFLFLNQDFLNK